VVSARLASFRQPGSVGQIGEASRVWLHHSLESLQASLNAAGSYLYLAEGDPVEVLPKLAKAIGVSGVYWNRSYDPVTLERDKRVKKALEAFNPTSFLATLTIH